MLRRRDDVRDVRHELAAVAREGIVAVLLGARLQLRTDNHGADFDRVALQIGNDDIRLV
uniref:Uncharacterized protein n=1 Tax=uncultured bacterium 59 TaxID=698390 RepID=E3T6G9_9BACT|nr:hypothetical protein [uncultured bacterium 59]